MVASVLFERPVLAAPGLVLAGGSARNAQWPGHLQADVRSEFQAVHVLASGDFRHGPPGEDAGPGDQEPVVKRMKGEKK